MANLALLALCTLKCSSYNAILQCTSTEHDLKFPLLDVDGAEMLQRDEMECDVKAIRTNGASLPPSLAPWVPSSIDSMGGVAKHGTVSLPHRQLSISRWDVVNTCAGLGNCMFVFQSALGVARGAGARLLLQRGDLKTLEDVFLLDHTLFDVVESVDTTKYPVLKEAHADKFTNFQVPPHGGLIRGYLQNLQYLQPLGLNLANLKLFWRFHRSVIEEARALLRHRTEWVGVHMRRFPARHLKHGLDHSPSPEEYNAVIQRAVTSTGFCVMVFSNDPDWARIHIRAPCIHFAENELMIDPLFPDPQDRTQAHATNAGRDLAALSMCHTLILSSGSYGLFAGILHSGEGSVHAFANGHHRSLGMHPPHWLPYPSEVAPATVPVTKRSAKLVGGVISAARGNQSSASIQLGAPSECTKSDGWWHAIIIWAGGMSHFDQILDGIRSIPGTWVARQSYTKIKSLDEFIEAAYTEDLRTVNIAKTNYLRSLAQECIVIAVFDPRPEPTKYGTGRSEIVANKRMVDLKRRISEQYDPVEPNGEPTHAHVIHVTDTPEHVDAILQVASMPSKNTYFLSHPEVFTPYHLLLDPSWRRPKHYRLTFVRIGDLKVACAATAGGCVKGRAVAVADTPHYAFLQGDISTYQQYFTEGRMNGKLHDDHSVGAFRSLRHRFEVSPYGTCECGFDGRVRHSVILINQKGTVQDGAHRAALLLAAGVEFANVAIMNANPGVQAASCAAVEQSNKTTMPNLADWLVSSSFPHAEWTKLVPAMMVYEWLGGRLEHCTNYAVMKVKDDLTFPYSYDKYGDDVDVLVENMESALECIRGINGMSVKRLANGKQCHADLKDSDGRIIVRLNLYGDFTFKKRRFHSQWKHTLLNRTVRVTSASGLVVRRPSLADECMLRWLEWHEYHQRIPKKASHLQWNMEHGCAAVFTSSESAGNSRIDEVMLQLQLGSRTTS